MYLFSKKKQIFQYLLGLKSIFEVTALVLNPTVSFICILAWIYVTRKSQLLHFELRKKNIHQEATKTRKTQDKAINICFKIFSIFVLRNVYTWPGRELGVCFVIKWE